MLRPSQFAKVDLPSHLLRRGDDGFAAIDRSMLARAPPKFGAKHIASRVNVRQQLPHRGKIDEPLREQPGGMVSIRVILAAHRACRDDPLGQTLVQARHGQ